MPRVFAFILLFSASVHADNAFDWKKTLDQPLSPGNVALLVEHAGEPEVQARWREALRHEAADVRASAARAIYAAGSTALLPDVIRALSTETEASAAREHMRAIVALGTETPAELFESVRRFPQNADLLGTLLGFRDGVQALAVIPSVREIDPDGRLRMALVRGAARKGREPVTRIASAVLRHDDGPAWEAVLYEGRNRRGFEEGVIAVSLMSPTARVRAATYFNLATRKAEATSLPEAVVKALAETPEARAEAGGGIPDERAAFAYELLARARGREPRENTAAVAKLDVIDYRGSTNLLYRHLTAAENDTVHAELKKRPRPTLEQQLQVLADFAWDDPPSTGLAPYTDLPRRYFTALAEAAGCRPVERLTVQADVHYDGQGRPANVGMAPADIDPACAAVARILFASSHRPLASGKTLPMEVSFERAELECAALLEDKPAPTTDPVIGWRPLMMPSRKIRDVKPVYPKATKKAGITGTVDLEGVVGPCGYVTEVHVKDGPQALQWPALDAVRRWRYEPATIDGFAVPTALGERVVFQRWQ